MNCLCHLWAHAAYALGLPVERFENASAELEAFATCNARRRDIKAMLSSEQMMSIMLLAGLFDRPVLRQAFLEMPRFPETEIRPKALDMKSLGKFIAYVQTLPVELLVPEKSHERSHRGIRPFQYAPQIYGSICRISGLSQVLISSPEMHLLLRAQKLNIMSLALVISEYCGTYRGRPDLMSGHSSAQVPLTSRATLAQFVAALPKGTRGRKRLAVALDLAFDNSASPRETSIAVLLALPRNKGGAGLKRPQLNESVILGPEAARLAGCSVIKPDFIWPDQRLCLEYQSTYFHRDQERIQADNNRAAALEQEGLRCLQITNEQVSTPEQFALLAGRISALLAQRNAPVDPRDERFRIAHHTLISSGFIW